MSCKAFTCSSPQGNRAQSSIAIQLCTVGEDILGHLLCTHDLLRQPSEEAKCCICTGVLS